MADHYLDFNGDPRYGWSLRCAHEHGAAGWRTAAEPDGALVSDDCWLMSWWGELGMEMVTDDPKAAWPGLVPIPMDVQGDGWGDGPLLVPTAGDVAVAGAAFENTERDRLAWRDRAWKAEKDAVALRARVEVLQEVVRQMHACWQKSRTPWQSGSPCEAEFLTALAGEGEA